MTDQDATILINFKKIAFPKIGAFIYYFSVVKLFFFVIKLDLSKSKDSQIEHNKENTNLSYCVC